MSQRIARACASIPSVETPPVIPSSSVDVAASSFSNRCRTARTTAPLCSWCLPSPREYYPTPQRLLAGVLRCFPQSHEGHHRHAPCLRSDVNPRAPCALTHPVLPIAIQDGAVTLHPVSGVEWRRPRRPRLEDDQRPWRTARLLFFGSSWCRCGNDRGEGSSTPTVSRDYRAGEGRAGTEAEQPHAYKDIDELPRTIYGVHHNSVSAIRPDIFLQSNAL